MEFRAAYFQTLARPPSLEQTLEPTQLGGFNQFDDEAQGVESSQYSAGIDIDAGHGHRFGLEGNWSESDVPIAVPGRFSAEADLTQARLFWNWGNAPWSISAHYQFEKSEFGDVTDNSSIAPSPLKTHRVPVHMQWQSESGWILAATATYIHQDGDFYPNGALAAPVQAEDEFTVLDIAASYQFWSNHAELQLRVNNAFDESFRYQSTTLMDTTPRLPAYMPERVILAGFKIAY